MRDIDLLSHRSTTCRCHCHRTIVAMHTGSMDIGWKWPQLGENDQQQFELDWSETAGVEQRQNATSLGH